MSLTTTVKRQAVAQGFSLLVNNITGSYPRQVAKNNGIDIVLNADQTRKMQDYITNSLSAAPRPDDLNVSLPWASMVLTPVLKKYWYAVAAPVAILIGIGFYLGKK